MPDTLAERLRMVGRWYDAGAISLDDYRALVQTVHQADDREEEQMPTPRQTDANPPTVEIPEPEVINEQDPITLERITKRYRFGSTVVEVRKGRYADSTELAHASVTDSSLHEDLIGNIFNFMMYVLPRPERGLVAFSHKRNSSERRHVFRLTWTRY